MSTSLPENFLYQLRTSSLASHANFEGSQPENNAFKFLHEERKFGKLASLNEGLNNEIPSLYPFPFLLSNEITTKTVRNILSCSQVFPTSEGEGLQK
jgi:hypothetical protein